MAVKFLSDEWAQALKTELNASDSFKEAATGKTATIQQVISGGADEIHYWISLADGAIDMGIGDAESPDATITESYEVAVALAKSELSPVTAFMTGSQDRGEHGHAAGCRTSWPCCGGDGRDRRGLRGSFSSSPTASSARASSRPSAFITSASANPSCVPILT